MDKGVIIFASNNGLIDYIKIACASAGFVRKNLSGFDEICLITDEQSVNTKETHELIEKYFDRVIYQDSPYKEENIRLFKDGGTGKSDYAPFVNKTRSDVYALTHKENLVIDCDYFVMSNTLDQVWGSESDFMINCQYRDIAGRHGGNVSILMISQSCIGQLFFILEKSEYAENLFALVEHIKNNYKYYYFLYNCGGTLFRNDFAFSLSIY